MVIDLAEIERDQMVDEFVERTTRHSGVEYYLDDPALIEQIARLLT